MLQILLGFLPWIIFSALFGTSSEESTIAVVAALAILLFTDFQNLKKGFVLVWGGLLFFPSIYLLTVVFKFDWAINNASMLSNISLALITWISLLIGKPFTLQYAREMTPKHVWNTPSFIAINQHLTTLWGLIFTFSFILHFIVFASTDITNFLHKILSYGAIFLGMWLNKAYPDWYMKRLHKKTNQANPFLQGNYAPIREESDFTQMPMKGKIPTDLPPGTYMRNGPNPAFEPITYTYPFDGDGMIHAMYLNETIPKYKNRYVKTRGLLLEQKFGHAIYGGFANPMPPDDKYFGSNDKKETFKNGAFVHIIRHAGRYLAILERTPAYEMDADLNTLGEWCPGTEKPLEIGPHTRLDPDTQHLFLICYDINPPYLQVHEVDDKGMFVSSRTIEKPCSTMMHDFVLTKNYFIVFDCPAVLDVQAAEEGGSFLQWKSEMGTRIGLIPRLDKTKEITWIKLPAFFVFHFANAYEENNKIMIDYVRYNSLLMNTFEMSNLYRMIIDLNTMTAQEIKLSDHKTEFPTFNLHYNSKPYRYIYAPIKQGTDYFNTIMKYDLHTQSTTLYGFGSHQEIGEAVFAPANLGQKEDDGYLMMFVYDQQRNSSDFVILNARDLATGPICSIELTRRVPHGLHGSWFEKLNNSS